MAWGAIGEERRGNAAGHHLQAWGYRGLQGDPELGEGWAGAEQVPIQTGASRSLALPAPPRGCSPLPASTHPSRDIRPGPCSQAPPTPPGLIAPRAPPAGGPAGAWCLLPREGPPLPCALLLRVEPLPPPGHPSSAEPRVHSRPSVIGARIVEPETQGEASCL